METGPKQGKRPEPMKGAGRIFRCQDAELN